VATINIDTEIERKKSNHLLEDSAADADVGGEGALLVNVGSLNSALGSLEAYTYQLGFTLQVTRPFRALGGHEG
jgi:hypothetical protein